MASEEQHVEVAVELRPGADRDVVADWLRERGLDAQAAVVGFAVIADATAVRSAFGTEPQGTLPVPEELRAHVKSVEVGPPREFLPNQ